MTLEIIKRLLSEQFDVEPEAITPQTDFYEDLCADSLDMVELAMACEEEFDIVIEDTDESWAVTNVAQLVDYVESLIRE